MSISPFHSNAEIISHEDVRTSGTYSKRGVAIVRRSLSALVRQIASNAGHDGAVVSGKLLDQTDTSFGFNAATDQYENLVAAGVIDPTKVVRTALQNAASVASMLLTTEVVIAQKPEKKKAEEAAKRPRREKIKKEKPKTEKATRAAKGGGKG